MYWSIRFFGLDDVYHTPWFYTLVILFALNLTLCTFRRFLRLLKTRKETPLPDEEVLKKKAMNMMVTNHDSDFIIDIVKKRYRMTHTDGQGAIFEKGVLSRYGSLIIHCGIIITLMGSFIGLLYGYKGFVVLRKGEIKDHMVVGGRHEKRHPLGFSIRCKDFAVSFYPGGEPKDYVTTLEIIDNSRFVMEKPVRVNHPLSYKGLRFYQATYGNEASFLFTIGGEKILLREREVYRRDNLSLMVVRFARQIHDFGPGVLIAYLDGAEPKTVWFLKDVKKMKEQTLSGVPVRLDDIADDFFTGLEVSRDPGVGIVWTGFACILFGLFVHFFMYHRNIYLRKTADGMLVAGVCGKNPEGFRKEFSQLEKEIHGNRSS